MEYFLKEKSKIYIIYRWSMPHRIDDKYRQIDIKIM